MTETDWKVEYEQPPVKTLRDEFAMTVLVEMLRLDDASSHPGKAARWAYELADAMIAERNKSND